MTAADGEFLFRITHQHKSVSFVLPIERISSQCLEEIRIAVSAILERKGRLQRELPERPGLLKERELLVEVPP